ncbi:RHS repeat-associated protein [Mucilaginibacter frigoritolerans]|uniref:RHS repeat-associated protein n=1 Tax=Mucilaginibacter frigoritolerans TaxID=652788 RepID=A0A562TPT9_9SPHI|nr:DUF6443 domain-containing protein [Mucilaginibacter frigoritolerans]TWI95611.1 RHS repeat-associated protein [Mucilaginibacter frigoritolerans]
MNLKPYFTLLLACILQWMGQELYAQSPGFVQQDIIKVANITTDAQTYSLGVSSKQTTRIYYDGLGRNLQSVAVQASPLQNDQIQPVAYDNLGRQTKSYLPYAGKSTDPMGSYRPNAISTDQPAFYTGQNIVASDNAPYSQAVFENSPLQRMLQAGMVGSSYQPGVSGNHYKTVIYRPNTSSDGNIIIWNPDGTFTANNYYAAGNLSVTDGTDEDGVESLVFNDLAGRTILKRQKLSGVNMDTYYIYNLAGMISYIVPPAATNILAANNYNLTIAPLSNLVFNFVYNNQGQLIQKTVPAKGAMFIIYDPLNRPVLMQDALMRTNNQWNYIKYDAEGRAISQGIYIDAVNAVNSTTPATMQAYVNTFATSYTTLWYESRTATLTNNGYYTNSVFPTGTVTNTSITPLAYAYYDDYDLNHDGTADFSYVTQNDASLPNEETATTAQLKGMPTMVCKSTVAGLTNTWLTTVTFYDRRLNPIQVRSNNHVYYNGYTTSAALTDTKTVVNDFTGAPQVSKVVKQTTSTTSVTVYTQFTYDQVYRVTAISQKYNTGNFMPVANYTYNELGQVINKKLGQVSAGSVPATQTLNSTFSGTNTIIASNSINMATGFSVPSGSTFSAYISPGYLQSVDYRYNIRGQVTSINNSTLSNDNGLTNADSNDLFGMQMLYDQTDSNLGNTPKYNGKLSAVKWMSKDGNNNSSYERAFVYSYDAQDRYTGEIYNERPSNSTTSTAFTTTHGWDETGISYDLNGNLLSLSRNTGTQGSSTYTNIDNLTYTPDPQTPDRLKTVGDASNNALGFIGGTGNYTYDANGNLAVDPYKGISQISYSFLNRTSKIAFTSSVNRYITYVTDANGTVLRKQQYDNVSGVATIQHTTDYVDGFVYLDGVLSYFPMPEGRVVNNAGTLTQEFIITDGQGNARISFNNTGAGGAAKVVQENSYYGFGMIMPSSPVATPTVPNKDLYNGGSEWQNDYANLPDYYQTFNRNYDAALGRFIGVDPEAESAESMTTYQYAGNNPIMNNDPLGNLLNADKLPPLGAQPVSGPSYGNFGGGDGNSLSDFVTWSDAAAYAATGAGPGSSYLGTTIYRSGTYDTNEGSVNTNAGVGDIASAISSINNWTGQQVGSNAGVYYGTNKTGIQYYEYQSQTANGVNANGDVDITDHYGFIINDANAGGMAPPGLLGGQSNPASWVFTPAGPDANYQTAGVSGILFHELKLEWNPKEMGVKAAIVIMRPLYFELPRVTSMFGKTDEIMSSVWAAGVSAGAVNAAIRAADKAWDNSNGELNQYQLGNIFLQSLRTIIQSVGGRVSTQPNYPLTIVRPYSTL